jgi:hypothetical protein
MCVLLMKQWKHRYGSNRSHNICISSCYFSVILLKNAESYVVVAALEEIAIALLGNSTKVSAIGFDNTVPSFAIITILISYSELSTNTASVKITIASP